MSLYDINTKGTLCVTTLKLAWQALLARAKRP